MCRPERCPADERRCDKPYPEHDGRQAIKKCAPRRGEAYEGAQQRSREASVEACQRTRGSHGSSPKAKPMHDS